MIYLASPYSHPDESVRQARFEAACRAAADLVRQGLVVFSPIAHSHPIAVQGHLPVDWDFWQGECEPFVRVCESVLVLQLEGWEDSRGVQAEIALAKELGKCVEFIKP